MRLPLLKLLHGVCPLSRVVRVSFERVSRPPRRSGETVVLFCSQQLRSEIAEKTFEKRVFWMMDGRYIRKVVFLPGSCGGW